MRIAILQRIPYEFIGVMHISSIIKRAGSTCEVFIADLEGERTLEKVALFSPEIIAFSIMSVDYAWFRDMVSKIHAANIDVPIIVGGVHATLFPELIEQNDVDAVFVGEAENSLEQFLCHYSDEKRLKSVEGLYYKDKSGMIFRNGVSKLISNLDVLPFPDRGIYYDKYDVLSMKDTKHFLTSRGCPFQCTYCYNKSYQDLYKGKGSYIRHFSQERIIHEIVETRKRYFMKCINFSDDAFTQNPQWLNKFLLLYKKEVSLPFICSVRADMMTDALAGALKDAGVHTVMFGIECGSEKIRNEILNKRIKDNDIRRCAEILREYKIPFGTFNMFAIPSETIEDAFKTVKLNIEIKTDLPWASILMPLPKTEIVKIANDLKLLPENFDFNHLPTSFFMESPLILHKKYVYENLQKVFYFAVKYPWSLPLWSILIRINFPLFFKGIFALSFLLRFSKIRNIPLWKSVKILWGFRNVI